ncbi:MAG TPA: hypothetical protein PLQ53_06320 [Saprospiraceae bacterium]|jgi:hypothetical protein|nr:MAG: hypothetical protein HWD63_13095 [Candidatus Parvibacillus calidus]HQQ12951.1 hypothetical protein [Bacteroidales bacterium]HRN33784.1 hypothetical protein [Saprospiraceae bacterium]
MRKTLLVILAILMYSLSLTAQNLTMEQLLDIKKKDLGNVEDFLTANRWEFFEDNRLT